MYNCSLNLVNLPNILVSVFPSFYNIPVNFFGVFKGKMEAIDDASVGSQQSNGAVSIKSIDSVASVEVHVISNIRHPPKNLVLAATACVILLTPGPEVLYCTVLYCTRFL